MIPKYISTEGGFRALPRAVREAGIPPAVRVRYLAESPPISPKEAYAGIQLTSG